MFKTPLPPDTMVGRVEVETRWVDTPSGGLQGEGRLVVYDDDGFVVSRGAWEPTGVVLYLGGVY